MWPIGHLRKMICSYWDRDGAMLMKNEGVASATQEQKRQWISRIMDVEPPTTGSTHHFWSRLTPEQKQAHLMDAFPE